MRNAFYGLRRARVAIVATLVAVAASRESHASCSEFRVEEAFVTSSAVFLGRVLRNEVVRSGPGSTDVDTFTTFEVERTWRGPRHRSIKVASCGGGDVVCTVGIDFIPGRDYLVFASGNRLLTSSCGAFEPERAEKPLKWLRRRPSQTPG